MSDYIADISTNDYTYLKEISITEVGGEDRTDFPVKLTLNSTNFNFELAESDGTDLRVGEGSNGTRILNMWIAAWDATSRIAAVWIKIPSLLANETKTLYAYWGNSTASDISDVDSVGFLFADGFDDEAFAANLALNKTAAQSSTSTPASNAVDGSTSTYCHTYSSSSQWWQVDLGAVYNIDTIQMIKRTSYPTRPADYYIQTADDWAFTTNVVNIITANNEVNQSIIYTTVDFGSVSTRYLRVQCHTSVQYINIAEFRVYQTPSSKWSYSGSMSVSDSKIRFGTDAYIQAKTNPLSGITNWIVEEGVYVDTGGDGTYISYRPLFYGTENDFGYYYYVEGDVDRKSNLVDSSTWITYNGTEKGLESDSYSENSIAYYEPTDKVYQSMKNRNSYSDYTDSTERKVYGDTRATYFRIYGRNNSAAAYADIDWIVVREFFLTDPYTFNTNNLFVPWEQVDQETINFLEYGADITSTDYYHYSSYGGNPYRLSNNATGSSTDCWYSDDGVGSGEVELVIDFGRLANNLVSDNYLHYDSGHVGYKNASKLSNNDTDVWGNDHFEGTTSSGYVCIDFGYNATPIACVGVQAYTTASGMIKDFTFDGSYTHPLLADPGDWENLYTGTFVNTLDWQTAYFTNGKPFRYYRINILNTYNDASATLQEWEMYGYSSTLEKKVVSQLRLRPITLASNEIYFPRYITFEGSNGLDEWDTLIPTRKTYTPFYDYMWERWQRYSFTNTKGYYQYKVTCSGNWNGNEGLVGISEWEMLELASEDYKYRILGGTTSNFNNIWADATTTFDDGFIYIVNDNLNTIKADKLSKSTTIVGAVIDLNVI